MTLEETARLIASISVMWPQWVEKRNIKGTVETWQRVFKNDDYKTVGKALGIYFSSKSEGFAPDPGQLRDIMNQMKGNDWGMTPLEAWQRVYKAVRNSQYYAEEEFNKLPPFLQRIVGSPEWLHDTANIEDEGVVKTVISSQFQKTYTILEAKHREYERLPEDMKTFLPPVMRPTAYLEACETETLPAADDEDFVEVPDEDREKIERALGIRRKDDTNGSV